MPDPEPVVEPVVDPAVEPAVATPAVEPVGVPPTETLDDILNGVTIEPNEPPAVAPPAISPTPTPVVPPVAPVDPNAVAPIPVYATQADIDAVNTRLDRNDEVALQQQVNADIKKAVDLVKLVAPNVSERAIKGDLYARADEDPRFAKAFNNLSADPGTWEKVLRKVGEELHNDAQVLIDPQLAANQEALNAANAVNTGGAPVVTPDAGDWDVNDAGFMNKFYSLAKG